MRALHPSGWWDTIQARFGVLHIQDFLSLEDFDRLAKTLSEAHCNGVLNACVLNDFVPEEKLSAAVEALEKRGLKMVVMVVSFNGSKGAESMGIPFPDYYVAEDIEGGKAEWMNPLTGELANVMWCPVRPQRRRKLVEMCRKLVDLGVHGIMLDYIRYGGARYCYCDYCKEKMLRDGIDVEGLSLRDTVDPKNPVRQRITSWRAERITSLVREISEKVHEMNPDVALGVYTVNHSYPESNLFSLAQDFEELSKVTDFIMPGSYYTELWGSTWPGVVAEYMKTLSKKARIWVGLASYRLRTGQMLKLNIYEAFAHGADGVIEFGGSPEGVKSHNRPHHWEALRQAYEFIEAIEPHLSKERVKPTIVPYSIETAKKRGAMEGIPYTDRYREALQAFMGMGIPVAAGKPEEETSCLILTGLEALTRDEAEEVKRLVTEKGLGLLAFFQSGLYTLTEDGRCLQENLLGEALGDEYGEPSSIATTVKVIDSEHPILEGLTEDTPEGPYPFGMPMANILPVTSKVILRSENPNLVLLTANMPGKGRAVHFCWMLTEDKNYLKEPYRRLYMSAFRWAAKRPLAYIMSGHNLDLTVRRGGKEIFLLLVNIMKGPTLYNPRAVRDVKVYLEIPVDDIASAEAQKGAEVTVEPYGKGTVLRVSVVDDVEGITVNLK